MKYCMYIVITVFSAGDSTDGENYPGRPETERSSGCSRSKQSAEGEEPGGEVRKFSHAVISLLNINSSFIHSFIMNIFCVSVAF